MDDLEQQWAALNGDRATLNDLSDRQGMQREQDHFGFVVIGVIGTSDEHAEIGDIIHGIHIGLDRHEASDITLKVIGISSIAEWREHVLFNFGPAVMHEFDAFVNRLSQVVRAIAE